MLDHDIISTIRARESQPGDTLGACVLDALLVGTRVVPREPLPAATPLHRALLDAIANSTTWRT